ncbi:MAG: trigger factor [Bacteroidota bacterium]
MDVTINTLSGVQQEAEIAVTGTELQPVFERAYEKYRQKVELKGFRKGKAPMEMIKRMYGEAIEHESLDDVVDEFYKKAMQEKNIRPVGQPKMVDMDFKRGELFKFKIAYEVRPEIELKKYKGVSVEKPVHKITEEEINAEIEHLRRTNSTTEEVKAVTDEEHIVTADVQELDDAGTPLVGKKSGNTRFLLSDTSLAPEIKAALSNAEVDGTYRVSLETSHGDHSHTMHAALTVSKIEKVILPPFDDELVKKITKDKITSAEEFLKNVREDIAKYWQDQAERKLRDAIAEEIVRTHEFDVPESMVNSFLDAFVEDVKNRSRERTLPKGFDEKKFREESRSYAIWQSRWMLLKETIAEKEGLTVEEADIDQLADAEAGRVGIDKERLLEYYKSSGAVAERLLSDKVMALLKSHAKIKEVDEPVQGNIA